MDIKIYFKVTLINLVLLGIGTLLEPIVVKSSYIFRTVPAQDAKTPNAPEKKAEAPKPASDCDDVHFECVSPGITTGTAGFGIVLAHRIASDELMVNGYDPLKLDDAILSALQRKGVFNSYEVMSIVNAAKVERPLRFKSR
jgi:hypothetical protein